MNTHLKSIETEFDKERGQIDALIAEWLAEPDTSGDVKTNKPVDRQNVEAILLTAREVAALCQVSLSTIARWRRAGELPAPKKIGRLVRWAKSDIVAWANSD